MPSRFANIEEVSVFLLLVIVAAFLIIPEIADARPIGGGRGDGMSMSGGGNNGGMGGNGGGFGGGSRGGGGMGGSSGGVGIGGGNSGTPGNSGGLGNGGVGSGGSMTDGGSSYRIPGSNDNIFDRISDRENMFAERAKYHEDILPGLVEVIGSGLYNLRNSEDGLGKYIINTGKQRVGGGIISGANGEIIITGNGEEQEEKVLDSEPAAGVSSRVPGSPPHYLEMTLADLMVEGL